MGKKNKRKSSVTTKKIVEQKADQSVVEQKIEKVAEIKNLKETKSKKTKKEKKENRLLRRFKETGSELKKVTWPTFPKVVKQTGVVLAVVIFFGVILFGFDYLLKFLFELLVG